MDSPRSIEEIKDQDASPFKQSEEQQIIEKASYYSPKHKDSQYENPFIKNE